MTRYLTRIVDKVLTRFVLSMFSLTDLCDGLYHSLVWAVFTLLIGFYCERICSCNWLACFLLFSAIVLSHLVHSHFDVQSSLLWIFKHLQQIFFSFTSFIIWLEFWFLNIMHWFVQWPWPLKLIYKKTNSLIKIQSSHKIETI